MAEEKRTEQIDLQRKLKASLTDSADATPTTIVTKEQAQGLMQNMIEPDSDQVKVLLNHFHSIGADDHILSDRDELNEQILQKWYQQLVIRNKRFPRDIPIEFTLEKFFEAILQNEIELKGFNLAAHIKAFHEYLDMYEPTLRASWYHYQQPNQRPKAIAPAASVSEEEEKANAKSRAAFLKKAYGAEGVPEHLQKYIEEDNDEK